MSTAVLLVCLFTHKLFWKVFNLPAYHLAAGTEIYDHSHRKPSSTPSNHGGSDNGWQAMSTHQPTPQMLQTPYYVQNTTSWQLATTQHPTKMLAPTAVLVPLAMQHPTAKIRPASENPP